MWVKIKQWVEFLEYLINKCDFLWKNWHGHYIPQVYILVRKHFQYFVKTGAKFSIVFWQKFFKWSVDLSDRVFCGSGPIAWSDFM